MQTPPAPKKAPAPATKQTMAGNKTPPRARRNLLKELQRVAPPPATVKAKNSAEHKERMESMVGKRLFEELGTVDSYFGKAR